MSSTNSTQPLDRMAVGKEMAEKFLGKKFYESIVARMKDDVFTKASMEYIWETCFYSYARPELQSRERSFMNLAMMIALNRGPELRIHVRAAVNNGLTEAQICEACRHAMIYCGVPAGRDALQVASEVFERLRASGEYPA